MNTDTWATTCIALCLKVRGNTPLSPVHRSKITDSQTCYENLTLHEEGASKRFLFGFVYLFLEQMSEKLQAST